MIKNDEIKYTKRVGHIYELICDIDNIKVAINSASKGKGNRSSVKRVLSNIDYFALKIQEMLLEKSFEPAPYIMTIRHDGIQKKERLIAQPKFFPDQCVHHALMAGTKQSNYARNV